MCVLDLLQDVFVRLAVHHLVDLFFIGFECQYLGDGLRPVKGTLLEIKSVKRMHVHRLGLFLVDCLLHGEDDLIIDLPHEIVKPGALLCERGGGVQRKLAQLVELVQDLVVQLDVDLFDGNFGSLGGQHLIVTADDLSDLV